MKNHGLNKYWKFLFFFLLFSVFINIEVLSQIDSSEVDEPIPEKINQKHLIYLVDTIYINDPVLLSRLHTIDPPCVRVNLNIITTSNIFNVSKDSINLHNFVEFDSTYICVPNSVLLNLFERMNNQKLYDILSKDKLIKKINTVDDEQIYKNDGNFTKYKEFEKPDFFYLFLVDIQTLHKAFRFFNDKILFQKNCYVKIVTPHYSN
jgi:hypothetical protein